MDQLTFAATTYRPCQKSIGSRKNLVFRRQVLTHDLKQGEEIAGVALSNPEPILSVRTR
jgi:hypothetical protein